MKQSYLETIRLIERLHRRFLDVIKTELDRLGWRIVKPTKRTLARIRGKDVPPHAETMVGRNRMHHVHELVEKILAEDVPGDLVETGVWRGGTVDQPSFRPCGLDAYLALA